MTFDELVGHVDAELAQALLHVNRSCAFVDLVQRKHPDVQLTDRVQESFRRARAVREAILEAGIVLPPPRLGDPPALEVTDDLPAPGARPLRAGGRDVLVEPPGGKV